MQILENKCPECGSTLVEEEAHEFLVPDVEDKEVIVDHFHCWNCGMDFLNIRGKITKLGKHENYL